MKTQFIIELICSAIGIALIFIWYDWKLFLILSLILFSNNLMLEKNIHNKYKDIFSI